MSLTYSREWGRWPREGRHTQRREVAADSWRAPQGRFRGTVSLEVSVHRGCRCHGRGTGPVVTAVSEDEARECVEALCAQGACSWVVARARAGGGCSGGLCSGTTQCSLCPLWGRGRMAAAWTPGGSVASSALPQTVGGLGTENCGCPRPWGQVVTRRSLLELRPPRSAPA